MNLRAWGQRVCRFHGARRNVIKGEAHYAYRHGEETQAKRNERSEKAREFENLVAAGIESGLFEPTVKLRGRPAKTRT